MIHSATLLHYHATLLYGYDGSTKLKNAYRMHSVTWTPLYTYPHNFFLNFAWPLKGMWEYICECSTYNTATFGMSLLQTKNIMYLSVYYYGCTGADKRILVWDIGKASKVCELKGHTDTVYQLVFSRDGTILASGIIHCSILSCHRVFSLPENDVSDQNNVVYVLELRRDL